MLGPSTTLAVGPAAPAPPAARVLTVEPDTVTLVAADSVTGTAVEVAQPGFRGPGYAMDIAKVIDVVSFVQNGTMDHLGPSTAGAAGPPPGQRLVGFAFDAYPKRDPQGWVAAADVTAPGDWPQPAFRVDVDGMSRAVVGTPHQRQVLIVSVPASASDVVLVASSAGKEQRFSATRARRIADPAFDPFYDELNRTLDDSYDETDQFSYTDELGHTGSASAHVQGKVMAVSLVPWVFGFGWAAPGSGWLVVDGQPGSFTLTSGYGQEFPPQDWI